MSFRPRRSSNGGVRWGRRKTQVGGGSMWFFIILGAIVFLLMEHPVVFWVVFVPLILLFIASVVKSLKSRDGITVLKGIATSMFILAVMIVALMIVCIP